MSVTARQVLWTASACHALVHVFELAVPALLLLIQRDFVTGDLSMGRVVTLYTMLFGLGALPAGFLVDRIGSRRLLMLCLGGAGLATGGMALSPSLGAFAACAAVMGLCLSAYHPAGTALLTHALPVSGRMFAVHGMMGNLGVAGSSVVAGALGSWFGWRWALGLLSAAGVIMALRIRGLPEPAPQDVRERPGHGQRSSFFLLLLSMAFMGMVYRGMTTFLPKFFAVRYASGVALGGALTTLALLVGLLGMFVAGRITDRGVRAPIVFLIGAASQLPFLLLSVYVARPALVPLMMAVAFFHFFTQPPGNYMVADFTPPRLRGAGYGIYFFVTFGVGSLGATLAGWASERGRLDAAFPALAAMLLPSIAVMLVLCLRGSRVRS